MAKDTIEIVEADIKREFQLERMILFSDAVFAIVITLMAIDIHLPEMGKADSGVFLHHLKHVVPSVIAYVVSFFFIGLIWYRHLGLFGLLKTYDGGLVFRNLFLLFSVGLFPFGASLIARPLGTPLPFLLYFSIVLLCMTAQIVLQHYVLISHPELRNEDPIAKPLERLRLAKISVVLFSVAMVLYCVVFVMIPDQEDKPLAAFAFLPIALMIRILRRRATKSVKAENTVILEASLPN